MKRLFLSVAALALLGFGGFLAITRPAHVDAAAVAALTPDPAQGAQLFWLGGCASCHTAENAGAYHYCRCQCRNASYRLGYFHGYRRSH